jgi:hypothetical protein
MHGQDILEDDPTYAGGTRVPSVRAVARPDTGKDKDVKLSTTAPEDEESREGIARRFLIPRLFFHQKLKVLTLLLQFVELLARAPLVPWDDDLAVWDKKDMAFNTSGLEYSHRFLGVGDGSNLVSQDTLDRMKMRTRIYNPELPKEIKVFIVYGCVLSSPCMFSLLVSLTASYVE